MPLDRRFRRIDHQEQNQRKAQKNEPSTKGEGTESLAHRRSPKYTYGGISFCGPFTVVAGPNTDRTFSATTVKFLGFGFN